jgi:hypothetical protein
VSTGEVDPETTVSAVWFDVDDGGGVHGRRRPRTPRETSVAASKVNEGGGRLDERQSRGHGGAVWIDVETRGRGVEWICTRTQGGFFRGMAGRGDGTMWRVKKARREAEPLLLCVASATNDIMSLKAAGAWEPRVWVQVFFLSFLYFFLFIILSFPFLFLFCFCVSFNFLFLFIHLFFFQFSTFNFFYFLFFMFLLVNICFLSMIFQLGEDLFVSFSIFIFLSYFFPYL